jgi:hypothetical protein
MRAISHVFPVNRSASVQRAAGALAGPTLTRAAAARRSTPRFGGRPDMANPMKRKKSPSQRLTKMSLREAVLLRDTPFWTGAALAVLDELPHALVMGTAELRAVLPHLSHPEH